MTDVLVRNATHEDAEAAVSVLVRSITELCIADHENDPETLALWLANKTPQRFAAWLAEPDSALLVAELAGQVRGVGKVARSGRVHLCYIEPGYQRRGIGAELLRCLEQRARGFGATVAWLDSSQAGCAFYAACGYVSAGPAVPAAGNVRAHPFRKQL